MEENTSYTQNPTVSSSFNDAFDVFLAALNAAAASGDFSNFGVGLETTGAGMNDNSTVLHDSVTVHDSTAFLGLSSPSAQYSFPESRLRVNKSNRYEPLSPAGSQYARSHGSSYQGSIQSENTDTSDPDAPEFGYYLFTAGSHGLLFNPALDNPLAPLQPVGEWQEYPGAYNNASLFRQDSFFGPDQLQGFAPPPPQLLAPPPPQPQHSQITARQLLLPKHQILHNRVLVFAISLINLSTALNGKVLLNSYEVKMYGARQEALKLDAYNRGLFSEGISTVITLRQSISKKLAPGNRVRRPLMTDAAHVVHQYYPYTDPTSANPSGYAFDTLKAYGADWSFMNAIEPRRLGQPILFTHDAVSKCVVDYLWGRPLSMAVQHPQYFIDSPNLWVLALVGVSMKHDFYLRRRRLRDKKPKPLSGARYAKDYKDLYALILAEWNDPIRGPAFQAWWKNVMAFGRRQHALGRARGNPPVLEAV